VRALFAARVNDVLSTKSIYVPRAFRFDFARVDVGKRRGVYDIVRVSVLYGCADLLLLSDVHLEAAVQRTTVVCSDAGRALFRRLSEEGAAE
jgi:hypothetical protein